MSTTNQYGDGLQKIRYDLFKSQDPETGQYDVIFEIEGKLLYVHKTMLTLVSSTFASMLSNHWTKNDEVIKIAGYGYDDFFQFITFLYSGQCTLTNSNIFSMIDMSEFYGVSLFKQYCDQFVAGMEISKENSLALIEFANKYSMVQLKSSVNEYITNNCHQFFTSTVFLNVSVFKELIIAIKDILKPETLFEGVYKWATMRLMERQTSDLDHNDAIKAEISDFLPHIKFREMSYQFLNQYVSPKCYIFSSYNELSKILIKHPLKTKVLITRYWKETLLYGYVIPDETVIHDIEASKRMRAWTNCFNNMRCGWSRRGPRPSYPSPIKKRDGIEWYLLYTSNDRIGLSHCSDITERDYLIAEMYLEVYEFKLAKNYRIQME